MVLRDLWVFVLVGVGAPVLPGCGEEGWMGEREVSKVMGGD